MQQLSGIVSRSLPQTDLDQPVFRTSRATTCRPFCKLITGSLSEQVLTTQSIQSVGLGETQARLLAACNSVSYLLFSLIGIPNVERWGRRKMLMYAAAGQASCYLFITVLIRYNEKEGYPHRAEVAKASVAFFFLYYVFFGIGFQGVPW